MQHQFKPRLNERNFFSYLQNKMASSGSNQRNLQLHKNGLWKMIQLDLERQQEILRVKGKHVGCMPKLIALYARTYDGVKNIDELKTRFEKEVETITSVPRLKLYAVTTFGATYQGKIIVDADIVATAFHTRRNRKRTAIFDADADKCYQHTTKQACQKDVRCNDMGSDPTTRVVTRNGDALLINNVDNIKKGMPIQFEVHTDVVESVDGNTITFRRFNAAYNLKFPRTMLPLREGENTIIFPTIQPFCQKKSTILPLYGRLPR